MSEPKLPHWLQGVIAMMGGGGLCIVTFLDSSVLSFPFVADALMIELSYQKPARMPLYAGLAAMGSLAGCVWLYWLAKKGGEAYFRRKNPNASNKVRRWVQQHAFLSVFVPAILPPPAPFKVFVLAEGVFQVPLRTFAGALLCGRGLRYTVEGILAVYYGKQVLTFLTTHSRAFIVAVVAALAVAWLASRWMFRDTGVGE
ncbi:MAG TPA: VTT domain-containing protein [Candidatus Acidoferrales bacterium]|nr:VTT domain-containing protein [Candidatus Acidoferrales bacterium]